MSLGHASVDVLLSDRLLLEQELSIWHVPLVLKSDNFIGLSNLLDCGIAFLGC